MTTASEPTVNDLLVRATAAERTVDVLKHKVAELYNGGTSVIQRAAERALAREIEMRRRQELATLRNAELARYNAQLEDEVAARTRDLQVILDNVVSGFLVVDRQGITRDGYTRSCVALLGRDDLAGKRVVDVLGFPPARRADFALQLELVFEDVLPEELSLDQLPRRSSTPDGRSLQIEGRVIRRPGAASDGVSQGVIDGVLFTITDITALEAAERERAHYQLLVQILRQRDAFSAFVVDFHGLATSGRTALLAGDQATARRVVHTMKGNAACFGLAHVAELAHAIEDGAAIDRAAFDHLTTALGGFLDANADVLGMSVDIEPAIQVSAADLAELESVAARGPAAVTAWVERTRCRPARLMLGPIEALVPRLAERFGKQVELVIEGSELRVDAEILRPVVRELGHLVRNAIDHGIESPDDRAGKPPAGQLTIRLGERGSGYELEVSDDGRGIDLELVVAKARAKGLCDGIDLENGSRAELLDLVFLDGLSTAETTNDVSGRGIGMSAIRSAVNSVGGTIQVHSDPGCGTRVEITVPRRRRRTHSTAA